MKVQLVLVSAFLLVACSCILLCSASENEVEVEEIKNGRASLPKLFDFVKFKQFFNKSYSSLLEELKREKIFLARAFRAFLSVIKFNRNKKSTYYRINSRSDLTEEEKKLMYNNLHEYNALLDKVTVDSKRTTSGQAGITPEIDSIEIIEEKLENIAKVDQDVASDIKILNIQNNDNNHRRVKRGMISLEELMAKHSGENQGSAFDNIFGFLANKPTGKSNVVKSDKEIETLIDYRNCFGPIKDQGLCGSCYIFSIIALYEYIYCKEFNEKKAFSEQFVLDCGDRSKPMLPGCRGGSEFHVLKFIDSFGFELSENYIYRAQSDQCPYEPEVKSQAMGQYRMDDPGFYPVDLEDFDEKIKENPICVHVYVPYDFSEYGGGIEMGGGCDRSQGHGMVIVGSGRQGDIDYWILRNSYGPDWGEQGYWRLNKKAQGCLDDRGFQVKGRELFERGTNANYDDKYVKQRKLDVEQGVSINKNPLIYVDKSELVHTPMSTS